MKFNIDMILLTYTENTEYAFLLKLINNNRIY